MSSDMMDIDMFMKESSQLLKPERQSTCNSTKTGSSIEKSYNSSDDICSENSFENTVTKSSMASLTSTPIIYDLKAVQINKSSRS